MYRDYDIFEVLASGSKVRVATVHGLEIALSRLEQLAKATGNECFVADARTRQIVALRNVPAEKERRVKRVFQIAYDEQLGIQRAEVLKLRGYQVISVVGNEKAKTLLSTLQRYSLFILGDNADGKTRSEMVDWLKERYPNAKILALNLRDQELPSADYNVTGDGPEKWLSIVAQQLGDGTGG